MNFICQQPLCLDIWNGQKCLIDIHVVLYFLMFKYMNADDRILYNMNEEGNKIQFQFSGYWWRVPMATQIQRASQCFLGDGQVERSRWGMFSGTIMNGQSRHTDNSGNIGQRQTSRKPRHEKQGPTNIQVVNLCFI